MLLSFALSIASSMKLLMDSLLNFMRYYNKKLDREQRVNNILKGDSIKNKGITS